MNISIVFLTVNPIKEFFDFAKLLKRTEKDFVYDVFVCVDDNGYILPEYDHTCITIIKFQYGVVEKYGFKNSVSYAENCACSRDKALYYFCRVDKKYDHVWMIEEDVFIPTIDTIYNIDTKHENSDLICRSNNVIKTCDKRRKVWDNMKKLINKIELPWNWSMVCAIRVSKNLLACIEKYATEKKELLFCEALFNTLAIHNNLTINCICELSNIVYNNRQDLHLNSELINKNYLYHPIKDIKKQKLLRSEISKEIPS